TSPHAVPKQALYLRHLASFPTRRSSDLDGRALRPMAGLLKPRKIRGQNDSKRGGKVLCGAFVGRVSARRQQGRAQHHSKSLAVRSEEHTSELQSPDHLVCRLLLEKKKNN